MLDKDQAGKQDMLDDSTDSRQDTIMIFKKMELCIRGFHDWFILNHLELNCDETEFIVFHSTFSHDDRIYPLLSVWNESVYSPCMVCNLGARCFDSHLKFLEHVEKPVSRRQISI